MDKFISAILLGIIINSPSLCQNGKDSLNIVEKVYLHTDRDYYAPGDDIWFKAYLIEVPYMYLSSHSRNLHVELISVAPALIDTRVIRLEGGLGAGDFKLADDLSPGEYRLRAYTNYMRNFGDQIFFNKTITVIGSSGKEGSTVESIKDLRNNIEIKFFPEGGSLVDNVTSAVTFKAVNSAGAGCDVSGEIYSSTGKLVTIFRSTRLGMGKFYIRPMEEMSYYAIAKNSDGDTVSSEIPKSFPTGITLSVSLLQNNEHMVTIRTNTSTLPLLIDHDLLLTLSVRKEVIKTLSLRINSLFTSFILPEADLPDGIVQATLSGPDELPFCERLIFVQNRKIPGIKLETSKKTYKQRDSVSVRISLTDTSTTGQETYLSLSAAKSIYLKDNPVFPSRIASWFLIESDVHGPVEEPSYYFDSSNPERLKDLDLLLCTQGWRDFEWKYKGMIYLPEHGFTVSGRVERLFSRKPLKNSSVTVLVLTDEDELIASIPTDSAGRFRLEDIDFSDKVNLILSATGEKGNLQGKLMLDPFFYLPEKIEWHFPQTYMILKENLLATGNSVKAEEAYELKQAIKKKYTLSDTILLGEVKVISPAEQAARISYITQKTAVGIPDNVITVTSQMENYINIPDIIRNRVSGVNVVTALSPGESGIRIRGSILEPLFMLDGVIVPYDMINTIPISWIEKIEILKSGGIATALGDHGIPETNGVISVITKPADKRVSGKQVFHSVNTIISGYNAPRLFYSPNYHSESEPAMKPDIRATLFWNPDTRITRDNECIINYYNDDNSSDVRIVVEGMTLSGIPVTGMTEYKVE